MTDLPTIAFRTDAGEQRRIRYERDDEDPGEVHRILEERVAGGAWRVVGSEPLVELVVDGEHRMPRGVLR
jgi:hypothetical protein